MFLSTECQKLYVIMQNWLVFLRNERRIRELERSVNRWKSMVSTEYLYNGIPLGNIVDELNTLTRTFEEKAHIVIAFQSGAFDI